MSVELRRAQPEDAGRVAQIFLRCWHDAYRGLLDDDVLEALRPAELEHWWASLIAEHEVVVAVDADAPVGMARFGADPDDASRGYLASLYVDPDSSGGGIGRTLLGHATERLSADGYEEATLWVFAGNDRALRFYRAAGWEPTGVERVDPEWRALQLQLGRALQRA